MQEIMVQKGNINIEALSESLRAAFGEKLYGISAGPEGVHIHLHDSVVLADMDQAQNFVRPGTWSNTSLQELATFQQMLYAGQWSGDFSVYVDENGNYQVNVVPQTVIDAHVEGAWSELSSDAGNLLRAGLILGGGLLAAAAIPYALVGGVIIGGITAGAYNIFATQGRGIGGSHEMDFSGLDPGQTGQYTVFGAWTGYETVVNYAAGRATGQYLQGQVAAGQMTRASAFWWGAGSEVASGTLWDAGVHGDNVTGALATNTLAFGAGEVIGSFVNGGVLYVIRRYRDPLTNQAVDYIVRADIERGQELYEAAQQAYLRGEVGLALPQVQDIYLNPRAALGQQRPPFWEHPWNPLMGDNQLLNWAHWHINQQGLDVVYRGQNIDVIAHGGPIQSPMMQNRFDFGGSPTGPQNLQQAFAQLGIESDIVDGQVILRDPTAASTQLYTYFTQEVGLSPEALAGATAVDNNLVYSFNNYLPSGSMGIPVTTIPQVANRFTYIQTPPGAEPSRAIYTLVVPNSNLTIPGRSWGDTSWLENELIIFHQVPMEEVYPNRNALDNLNALAVENDSYLAIFPYPGGNP